MADDKGTALARRARPAQNVVSQRNKTIPHIFRIMGGQAANRPGLAIAGAATALSTIGLERTIPHL